MILFGAPFVPTLKPQINEALTMLKLKPGSTIIELGCGDGRVMVAAAQKDYKVIGYELNPILFTVCWLRTRKYKGQAKVVWGNFWTQKLPKTDAIFVFLLQPYMQKLNNKITQEYSGEKVKLVSFAFEIPNKVAKKTSKGLFLYTYN